jgi:hypothetical protein
MNDRGPYEDFDLGSTLGEKHGRFQRALPATDYDHVGARKPCEVGVFRGMRSQRRRNAGELRGTIGKRSDPRRDHDTSRRERLAVLRRQPETVRASFEPRDHSAI